MTSIDRIVPSPRIVDWGLLATVLAATATGLVSLVATPDDAWVFAVHGILGVALAGLLAAKLWRVRRRLVDAPDRAVALSVALAIVVAGTIATGVYWVHGGLVRVLGGFWTLMNVHIGLGLVAVPLLAWHLRHRFRPVRRTDLDRRAALRVSGLLVAGAVVWRLQAAANAALSLAGVDRRATGSKEDGSGEGNAFPVTSWVADDPDPVDPDAWELRVRGRAARELSLSLADVERAVDGAGGDADTPGTAEPLPATDRAETRALLDCTSGWYSVHDWQGLRVGDLLAAADPDEKARYVRFRSITGYRWTLPIEEARDALLATHVDGERLSHGHGYPVRLVAPGRRGFQWVKWVTAVEVRRNPDPGQWAATLISGFD